MDPVMRSPVMRDPVMRDPVMRDPVMKNPIEMDPVMRDPVCCEIPYHRGPYQSICDPNHHLSNQKQSLNFVTDPAYVQTIEEIILQKEFTSIN